MSIDSLGQETNNVAGIIQQLTQSKIPFGLTGSRFFECSSPLSDYDFFAPNTDETKTFLISIGMKKLETTIYYIASIGMKEKREHPEVLKNSNNIAEVWGKDDIPIHIQLVNDIELKKKIQDVLKNAKLMPFLKNSCDRTPFKKTLMIHLWNLFYNLAQIESSEETIKAEVEKRLNEHNEQQIQQEVERRLEMLKAEKEAQEEVEKDMELLA